MIWSGHYKSASVFDQDRIVPTTVMMTDTLTCADDAETGCSVERGAQYSL